MRRLALLTLAASSCALNRAYAALLRDTPHNAHATHTHTHTHTTNYHTRKTQRHAIRAAAHEGDGLPLMADEPCNVVLTHTNADFDSLAGAVALAKLWKIEKPDFPTHVVLPRGVNPLVSRFLAYHKHLFPVRGLGTIKDRDVRAVGIVDTQSRERLGPAEAWLATASHVAVYDHHLLVAGDIEPDELVLEPVGSATTMLVERLRDAAEARGGGGDDGVGGASTPGSSSPPLLTEAEATLFALGIRADTGALSYADTTPRDGHALVWLMEMGASQSAIAEFGHSRLSAAQRDILALALSDTQRHRFEGMQLGVALIDTGRGFVTGMATVCEELLQLMALDVSLIGVIHANAKGATYLSLIGRCSVRAMTIDLNSVMGHWKGGGHPAAAAASVRLAARAEDADAVKAEAAAVLAEAEALVRARIPKQVTAADLMTTRIFALGPNATMEEARERMLEVQRKAIPVVDDNGALMGMLKYRDVMKAAQANKGGERVKAWMRRNVITVPADTTLEELETLMLEQSIGRLPVISEHNVLVGLVTRTDVLRQHGLYTNDLGPPEAGGGDGVVEVVDVARAVSEGPMDV